MTYGIGLNEEQTIAFKFAQKLKKTTYNLAIPGCGVNQILYMLDKIDIKKYIKEEPEYFIYFFNPDHLRRIFVRTTTSSIEPQFVLYKKIKEDLVFKANLTYEKLWLYSLLFNEVISPRSNFLTHIIRTNAEDYFLLYLSNIKSKIKQEYPNSKFVIVKFSNYDFNTDLNKFYNIIDIPQLTEIDVMLNEPENISKYNADLGFHPNEYYWDIVLPVIIQKLEKIK